MPPQVVILRNGGALIAEHTHWLFLSSFDVHLFLSLVAVEFPVTLVFDNRAMGKGGHS